jgi:hypothetical protein
MQKYQYKHGDRPLDGYTIQRAAGRGGFGEVYYALSDSGREVAIKAVQNYEQIEIRGISHCMNIKSPHLVTIFDVKHNDRNEPFVIMEYVSGLSLRDLLVESPHGLGAQKTAFFLREIAKGLSYLHECGIVHRDLKPGNVFYENGYVKIGDYGLAKAISASRHSGHTITVGTVHYMAPEIGAGSYNCSIDIYALGVLLYEMLTGDVPFVGSSPAEILMKHMTVTPELDKIEDPFARVIKKALAKDPAERYQTVQEMVEDLFGSPEELSVVAERVAAKANIVDEPRKETPKAVTADAPTRDVGRNISQAAQRLAQQAEALGQEVADNLDAKVKLPAGIVDSVDPKQRRTLAVLTMAMIAVGAGILHGDGIFPTAITVFVMTAICSKTILFSRQRWFSELEPESQWVPRIVMCCVAALLASMAAGFLGMSGMGEGGFAKDAFPFIFRFQSPFESVFGGGRAWLALAIPLFLVNWSRISAPQRAKRISLGSAIWIGLLGLGSAAISGQPAIVVAAVLAGTSLVVQAYSSYARTAQRVPAEPRVKPKPVVPRAKTPAGVSSFKRLWALVLALPGLSGFPFAGLHRFYVGKIGTGILWCLTGGLFMIGQIVDIIMILTGQFKDRYGLPLVIWQDKGELTAKKPVAGPTPGQAAAKGRPAEAVQPLPAKAAPKAAPAPTATVMYEPFHPLAFLFSGIGFILTFAAVLAGLVVGSHAPHFVAAGWPAPDLTTTLDQFFGYSDWPGLVMRLGAIIVVILLLLAAVFTIIGRRYLGARHLVRGMLGLAGFVFAFIFFSDAMSGSYFQEVVNMLNSQQIGPAVETLLRSIHDEQALFAGIFFLASVVVLAWPARRRQAILTPAPNQGVS